MKRLAPILLLLATAPVTGSALAQQPDRQPLLNITRGSPTTPGGTALLALAEASLTRAKEAAARGDTAAAEREFHTIVGDSDSGGFVRSLAAIDANAALAAQSKALSPADAARIGDCASGLADAAEAPSPSIERLEKGVDANGDGAVGWTLDECGLVQLRQMIGQMASPAGS
jgi:hypothetical protein